MGSNRQGNFMPYAGAAVYSATKAAVKTFSDGLRIDTIATDIKVTTIQPGIVETDFSTVRFHGDKERAEAVYSQGSRKPCKLKILQIQ